jgi:hypothetical protein
MTIYYGDRKDFGDVPSRIEKFILWLGVNLYG